MSISFHFGRALAAAASSSGAKAPFRGGLICAG
jgi:hypothetical protein